MVSSPFQRKYLIIFLRVLMINENLEMSEVEKVCCIKFNRTVLAQKIRSDSVSTLKTKLFRGLIWFYYTRELVITSLFKEDQNENQNERKWLYFSLRKRAR